MGKYLDIVRKLEREKSESVGKQVTTMEPDAVEPVKSGAVFTDLLTPTELGYYRDLLGIMQSDKFGMSQEAAEREAGRIIARNRQPLQIQQAARDYLKYGYVKIFSTVLDGVVYLARDQGAAKRVPNLNSPVYLESDIEAVKGLDLEITKVLLEARILFGESRKLKLCFRNVR